jgi:hypothetical protein
VDRQALAETLRTFSFLFSLADVDKFLACTTIDRLLGVLMTIFDNFGGSWGHDWSFMAAFVVDLIANNVIHDHITVESLTAKIKRLKSIRAHLTREFRTRKVEHEDEVSSLLEEIRELRQRVDELEASQRGHEHGIGEPAAGGGNRPDILREMNDLPARQGYRRYSDSLHYMAVVMVFRSRSTYEFLRNFLPLPARNSIYDHSRDDLNASLARLKSVDQLAPYLTSEIERHPDIARGAVLPVDAVACSSTFVGMKIHPITGAISSSSKSGTPFIRNSDLIAF